ncbi:stalk domain-containing protein [Paenibacillus periandrae]|uniref:stalk domain-containing protein n=1 Tax=Paenibacillus periandrae TaxID=1761741 RepID=UPI001F090ECA|nr:stalk domain-containing protein [Paenibacillus periandrae]
MKKFLTGLVLGIGLSSCTVVFASETIQAYLFPSKVTFHINGKSTNLDVSGENQIINYNNKAYIPLRLFTETLGAKVDYQSSSAATNGNNLIDVHIPPIQVSSNNEGAWTFKQSSHYIDPMIPEGVGVSFGKPNIDFSTKSIQPQIQFKNSRDVAIQIDPVSIEYQVTKVSTNGETVLFDYKIPPLDGRIPASSWFTANVPPWDFKDGQGNFVEPGTYALSIKVPSTLDYKIEDSGAPVTISSISRFSRWEYEITQNMIDQLKTK